MRCRKCGQEVPNGSKFCRSCGTPVIGEMNEKRSCRVCGAPLQPGNAFCKKCGAPVNSFAEEIDEEEEETGAGGKVMVIILGILIGCVIIFTVSFSAFYIHKSNRQKEKSRSVETEQEETKKDITENAREKRKKSGREQQDETQKNSESMEEKETQNPVSGTQAYTGGMNVEQEVSSIRTQYNEIVKNMGAGAYTIKNGQNGISAYYDGMELRAMVVPKMANSNPYAQYYYYDSTGNLIFAYYEAAESNRFYFKNMSLIRWRYSATASDSQNAVNYDLKTNDTYKNWESSVLDDSDFYMQMLTGTAGQSTSDYILPGSDNRYIDRNELNGLSAKECKLARNELYARHGRKFDDAELQSYFNSQSWYNGTIAPSAFRENMLNSYETYNRDLIVQYEKDMGYR